ncbi:MAG: hypothetical protein QNK23_07935 [Crocinitomicaceae bacterium]|nr:hypothetical protein [Crocinitomicaceae bacterium]
MGEETTKLFEIRNKIITSKFEKSDWNDLGIILNCSDLIESDPRLLRSLSWGDEDYAERATIVVSAILKRDKTNYW